MNGNNRKNQRVKPKTFSFTAADSTGALTAFRMFSDNLWDVLTTLEALRAEDGIRTRILRAALHLRLTNVAAGQPFVAAPVVVQTVGTWSDTKDQAVSSVGALLDASIDDVFGFDLLTELRPSRLVPNMANVQDAVMFTVPIPTHILQIINKELETERLQTLLIGVVGQNAGVGEITISGFLTGEFVEERKTTVLR